MPSCLFRPRRAIRDALPMDCRLERFAPPQGASRRPHVRCAIHPELRARPVSLPNRRWMAGKAMNGADSRDSRNFDNEARGTCDRPLPATDINVAAVGDIVAAHLTGGVRAFKLSHRQTAAGEGVAGSPSSDGRARARVITTAWGDRYIDDLGE